MVNDAVKDSCVSCLGLKIALPVPILQVRALAAPAELPRWVPSATVIVPVARDDSACEVFTPAGAFMPVEDEHAALHADRDGTPASQSTSLRAETALFEPPLPIARIAHLLSAAPVDLRELGEAVREDETLVSEALKLCNSSLFSLSQPVSSLEQAVSIMDADLVRTLIFACWLIKHTGSTVPERERRLYWRHSLSVAQSSRRIGEWAAYSSPEWAFLAGLFHDVGILPFLTFHSREARRKQDILFDRFGDGVESQRRQFGTDHCEIGALLGTRLGFPLPLIEVAARHHQRGSATMGRPLVCLVAAAEMISRAKSLPGAEAEMPTGQLIRKALAEYLPGVNRAGGSGLVEVLESDLQAPLVPLDAIPTGA